MWSDRPCIHFYEEFFKQPMSDDKLLRVQESDNFSDEAAKIVAAH
ncbi:hypothetical protein [Nostoc sp.]